MRYKKLKPNVWYMYNNSISKFVPVFSRDYIRASNKVSNIVIVNKSIKWNL